MGGPKVDEELIAQVREITHVSKDDAKMAIRNMDYDLSRAVEYILSGELEQDKAAQQHSGSTFGSAKGLTSTVKQYFTRSKGPPKNRNVSPSAQATETVNVGEEDDEDEQLRLAMEMSLQESSSSSRVRTPNPPDYHATERSSVPYFGPARLADHQEASWGMVVSSASNQETGVVDNQGNQWSSNDNTSITVVDGPPEERKRVDGQPVVLDARGMVGIWSTDPSTSLAGLLTILHKIPKAREVFLLASPRELGFEDGPDDTWWKGNRPSPNSAGSEDVDLTGEAILRESARIMTFMDDTDRAYGRLTEYLVNALQKDLSKYPTRGEPAIQAKEVSSATFLQRWTNIVQSYFQKSYFTRSYFHVFNAQIYQPPNAFGTSEQSEYITEISASVSRELSDAGSHTILDALEETIWYGKYPACLKTFSEILLIRLKRDDHEGGAGVEILPRLHLGRFAFDNYDVTNERIGMRRGLKETLQKLRQREQKLTWIEKIGTKYSAAQILESTISYVHGMEGKKLIDVDFEDDDPPSRMDIDSETTLPALSSHLRSSMEKVDNKLTGTNFRVCADQEIQNSVKNLEAKLLTLFEFHDFITRPSSEGQDATTTETRISVTYTLRGVVVDQYLTFFSQWEHYSNPYRRKLVWYKSDFSSSKPEIVAIEEGEVLTIARDRGSEGVITVYVRDDVPELTAKVLAPEYLREFIQKDNELFLKELNSPIIQVTEPPGDIREHTPTPPVGSDIPPGTVAPKSLNPFLNRLDKPEVESDVDGGELMVIDSMGGSVHDTNPFRRNSAERERVDQRIDKG